MPGPDPLKEIRNQIDTVDQRILELLKKRSNLVGEVTEIKRANNMEVYQPARYQALLLKLQQKAASMNLDPNLVEEIWDAIHESSKQQQEERLAQ